MSKKKPVDELQKSVMALESKSPYICSLRFPNYRNLQFDSELPFDFPITVLLGRNGTNKSSILHALYGSPYGQSIGDFWFETELDAIPSEQNGRKQSVVHRYCQDNGEIVECIKARASRIYRDIQSYANGERKDVFVIFDGDHKPKKLIPKDGELPQGESDLKKLIQELTRGNNQKGPDLDLVNADEMTRYIRFLRKSVYFLPGLTPEDLVWEENTAKELLGKELPEEVSREQDLKPRLHMLAEEIPGFDADTVFKSLLAKLLSGESQRKKDLIEVIRKIRSATV